MRSRATPKEKINQGTIRTSKVVYTPRHQVCLNSSLSKRDTSCFADLKIYFTTRLADKQDHEYSEEGKAGSILTIAGDFRLVNR